MTEQELQLLQKLLPEHPSRFPAKVKLLCGKTLAKTGTWWKAITMAEVGREGDPRYQLRLYGWQKNKEGVWKQRQKFNISSARYIAEVISAIQAFAPIHVKTLGTQLAHERLLNEIITLRSELSSEQRRRRKNTKKVRSLSQLLGEKELELKERAEQLADLKRQQIKAKDKELESRIPGLRRDIKEFEKLLNDKSKKENDYHKFLEEHPWMFGTWYVDVRSKKRRTGEDIADFELERYDSFHDLVELESPHDVPFIVKSGKPKLSTELKDAISEIIHYIEVYSRIHLKTFYEEQKDLYKPKGLVILGRATQENRRFLKMHNDFLHGIVIWTFDDLLERAKRSIDFIKAKKEMKV